MQTRDDKGTLPSMAAMTAGPLASLRIVAVRPDRADVRATAERVLAGPLVGRDDLTALRGRRPGGTGELVASLRSSETCFAGSLPLRGRLPLRGTAELWQADGWFLKSRALRTPGGSAAGIPRTDPEQATSALDGLFAVKRALGELSPARSILAVAATAAGVYQLWTIAPQLVTLRERLDATSAAARWDDFAGALAGYDLALGESLSSSLDAGICLDPSPANFATQGGRVRYIADDVAANRDAAGLEEAFVARFAEYPEAPTTVWDAYVWRFVRELSLRLSPRDRARLQLADRLRAAALRRCAGRPYVDRVLAALEAL